MAASRRQFLTYLGLGSYATLMAVRPSGSADVPSRRKSGPSPAFFEPIKPSSSDELVLPRGYKHDVIIRWNDPLGTTHKDYGPELFGFNCDFTAYFPIDALTGGKDSTEGLLWVNHEYPNPLFVSGYDPKVSLKRTAEQVLKEKLSVGGSVVHIKKQGDAWKPVLGSKFNRRFTALYPKIEMSGPTAQYLPTGTGTLANCSGGRTPWMTVLSCEENYPDYNDKVKGYGWSLVEGGAIDEREYGWVVEVDPFDELPPMKHTALGRFKHENAALRVGPTGKLVVYMGDDEADQCLYKFVSARSLDPKSSRAEQRKVLTEGTLYAADFLNGKWLPLDLKRSPALRDAEFLTQAEVMVRTRAAAAALKATPLDRCEDCEVHPRDGSLYVSLTNNDKHGNYYGQIVRLIEAKDDPEGEAFQYEIFLAGGPRSGLACPDNLAFDPHANLWVVCDISSKVIGKGAYAPFKNNGLYVVPTGGEAIGDAFQFASGPKECELTGPWFTEDASTLFLSVQHPGEESKSVTDPTSSWPDGKGHVPKPSVVAVSGFKW